LTDILILLSDVLGVSIMGFVGLWGMKYFVLILTKDELKNLRYIWVPSVISGGFFFVLVLGLLIQDVFGVYIDKPFYFAIHPFLLVGSGFLALSMYRFIKTVKSHMETEKRAETSIEQMRSELARRKETAR
jgi:hypothetical protein